MLTYLKERPLCPLQCHLFKETVAEELSTQVWCVEPGRCEAGAEGSCEGHAEGRG